MDPEPIYLHDWEALVVVPYRPIPWTGDGALSRGALCLAPAALAGPSEHIKPEGTTSHVPRGSVSMCLPLVEVADSPAGSSRGCHIDCGGWLQGGNPAPSCSLAQCSVLVLFRRRGREKLAGRSCLRGISGCTAKPSRTMGTSVLFGFPRDAKK